MLKYNGEKVINNYNIRTITIKMCELFLVSYITIKMCVVVIVYY